MNFLVDAQLPRRIARFLQSEGHDAIHTLDLPSANRTTDNEINIISLREHRVVITKDADFVSSFLLTQRPYKLLLVSTGNITNAGLETLFRLYVDRMVAALQDNDFVELTVTSLVIH